MPKIIINKKIKDKYYRMIIHSPKISVDAKPGQFLEVKVSNAYEPLLRRPFSIHGVRGSKIEILYEVLGPGTEILSQRKAGEYLDVIGPLGNGFNYGLRNTEYGIPLLVAGGMGIAPLLFLAERLIQYGRHLPAGRQGITEYGIRLLIGAKTKKQILCEKEFRKLGYRVKIATDDGSKGFKGKITDLLKSFLRNTHDRRRTTIFACGPRPMLKEISRMAQKYNIPAQISLEEHMACGIGACLGCVVNTKTGYQRVCKEGPVFNANEIVWEE